MQNQHLIDEMTERLKELDSLVWKSAGSDEVRF
jgi:hypothetical protein